MKVLTFNGQMAHNESMGRIMNVAQTAVKLGFEVRLGPDHQVMQMGRLTTEDCYFLSNLERWARIEVRKGRPSPIDPKLGKRNVYPRRLKRPRKSP